MRIDFQLKKAVVKITKKKKDSSSVPGILWMTTTKRYIL